MLALGHALRVGVGSVLRLLGAQGAWGVGGIPGWDPGGKEEPRRASRVC